MLPVELEPERTQDVYGNDNGDGYYLGENGDGTGSPYYTIDFSGYGNEGTVVKTVNTEAQSTPEIVQAIDAEKKKWYDVLEQIGGTASGLITAIKSPGMPGTTSPNINGSVDITGDNKYTPSVDDKKKNNTVWIILAIILIAVLLYFAFKKDK